MTEPHDLAWLDNVPYVSEVVRVGSEQSIRVYEKDESLRRLADSLKEAHRRAQRNHEAWLDAENVAERRLAELDRCKAALEMALPWLNDLVRDIGESGGWTAEQAENWNCLAARDAVRAALEDHS